MLNLLIVIFYCIGYATSQAENFESPPKSNWDKLTSTHQEFKQSAKFKRDKFSSILNLFKNALAEELENSYYFIDDQVNDINYRNDNNIKEKPTLENNENQIEKPILGIENESNFKNISEVAITDPRQISKSNVTRENIEVPNMIPIFKPRSRPKSEVKQNADFGKPTTKVSSKTIAFVPEQIVQSNGNTISSPVAPLSSIYKNSDLKERPKSKPISFVPEKIVQRNIMTPIPKNSADLSSIPVNTESRQIPNSRAISFVPERIVQTNINAVPNPVRFNIPCQRAADVLDMGVVNVEEVAFRNRNLNSNIAPVKSKMTNQRYPVHCSNENDTVAMLFKPKNITLEEVYGNLMKKTTLTVLVPYHVSKLGRK